MNYKKYTDGIIFVDDKKEEVDEAIGFFNRENVKTMFFTPLDVASNSSCLGYNFVFLDLSYDGNIDIKTAVIALKRIAEVGEKHIVVIAWTQHQEEIEQLKGEIDAKMSDCYPLKIINGEKFKIINRGEDVDFDSAFSEILNKLESENPLLFKLLEWKKNMTASVNEQFNKLIEKSYENKEINLNKNLGILANKTLSRKSMVFALNTLSQMVNDSAILKLDLMKDMEIDYNENDLSFEEKLKYNYDLLFSQSLSTESIPGSIYRNENIIKYDDLKKILETKKNEEKQLTFNEELCESAINKNISFAHIIPIQIDITPNCTYACNGQNTTYLEGIIVENIMTSEPKKIDELKGLNKNGALFYKYMNASDEICVLKIFPETCSSKLEKTEKIYQLNNNVKISIQQSFGAWISRVGHVLY